MKNRLLNSTTWKWLCSLKLTIILASTATLVAIGGSLLLPFYPGVFGTLESVPLGPWLKWGLVQEPQLTGWIALAGILVTLLALNTLCCFIDWLCHLRGCWRKSGEYLIHFGFVLILIAFWWGSLAGFRIPASALLVGQSKPLPRLDLSLQLEAFKPVLDPRGRPLEMNNTLALYRGEELLKRVTTRSNHPLLWKSLVVVPVSYGQTARAGSYVPYSVLSINYDPGAGLAFSGALLMGVGVSLTLVSFYRKRVRGDRPEVR